MTYMGEQCAAGTNAAGKGYGIIDKLMRVVRTVEAQGIDHKSLHTIQQVGLIRLDGLHVGDVGEMPEAETQDGQLSMHHADGQYLDVSEGHHLAGSYLVQTYGGYTRVTVGGKTIGQHLHHASACFFVGIDVDFTKLTVGTYIVHTPHMVVMGMSDEDSVNTPEGLRKNLLAEVGTTVYE